MTRTIRKRKAEIKSSIDFLDGIIKDGAVGDNNLQLLVDNIVFHGSAGLRVSSFQYHLQSAKNNGVTKSGNCGDLDSCGVLYRLPPQAVGAILVPYSFYHTCIGVS